MNSSPPTLTGFNNNVRYRGQRFHIQTEDSGVARPHITTHLFADGGHVIKSLRTDYAEYVDHPERVTVVQRLMREQHRAMALELRDGKLDATIARMAPPAPPDEEEMELAPETQLSAGPPARHAPVPRGAEPPAASRAAPGVAAPEPSRADPSRSRPGAVPEPPSAPPRSAHEPVAASSAASSARSGASSGDSQRLWDTELRPKNQRGRRRRAGDPRSSRRVPASSAATDGPGSAPASSAESSSRRSGPRGQRPSSRSGAASSRPGARPAGSESAGEAPSSRRAGSSRAGRGGATAAEQPRPGEPATSSRRGGARPPPVDAAEPPPSAPLSSRRGRPAAALPAKPGGPSLFGPLPQDSLDDAILTYAARAKTPPSSRGSK